MGNNKKGKTTNDDAKSTASPSSSDGVFVPSPSTGEDVKDDKLAFHMDKLSLFNHLDSLSSQERFDLLNEFATRDGGRYSPYQNVGSYPSGSDQPQHGSFSRERDNTLFMNHPMFNDRDKSLDSGFRPNKENFYLRETDENLRYDSRPTVPGTSFANPGNMNAALQPLSPPTPSGTSTGPHNAAWNARDPYPSASTISHPVVGSTNTFPNAFAPTSRSTPAPSGTTTSAPVGQSLPGTTTFVPSAQPTPWTTNTTHLPTGLSLRPTPRTDAHANYENDRVIISRFKRGTTDKDRAKIRELCTDSITPKITRGTIAKLLSSSTDEDYNIAAHAAQWQTSLGNIWSHVVHYDFKHIVLIPTMFDPNDVNSVSSTTVFVNSILDHDKLTNDHYFAWQAFIRRFGLNEELTSDAWLEDKLWKSLESDLRAEVKSDFDELPLLHKGAISLLRLIINRMVQSNQESRRAMEEFIKNFDIQTFPGEDVVKANLRIKAVAQSLGTTRLPSDIVHRVLEGFARSSTPVFSSFCHYQESMISSSLVKANLRQDNIYKTLITVLTDLEVKYSELLSGQRWLGIGNSMSSTKAAFTANTDIDYDDIASDNYDEYVALTVKTTRNVLPFDVWVKDKLCRNCNEVGHIQRDCPKPLRHTHRSTKLHRQKHEYKNTPRPGSYSSHKPPTTNDYTSKVKALISAACDLAHSATYPPTTTVDESSHESEEIDQSPSHDYSGFLAALGCPKE